MGSAERRFEKPECISPDTDRHLARSARDFGSSPAWGLTSLRYSAIARVSQILVPSCVRQGTRNDGDSSSNSARVEASSLAACCSSKSMPASLHSNQPRSDQEP